MTIRIYGPTANVADDGAGVAVRVGVGETGVEAGVGDDPVLVYVAVCGELRAVIVPVQEEQLESPQLQGMFCGLVRAAQMKPPLQSVVPLAGHVMGPVRVKALPEPAVYEYCIVSVTLHVAVYCILIVPVVPEKTVVVGNPVSVADHKGP